MKNLLRIASLLLVLVVCFTVSFADVKDVGDVPFQYGFETDSTDVNTIPVEGEDFNWIGNALWSDMAPDTFITSEGDTIFRADHPDGSATIYNNMSVVSDDAHEGTRSLFMANNFEEIWFHGGMEMDIIPENMELGAEYKVTFWTKYEITEGNAWWGFSLYDGYEQDEWTGLSDGWEKKEYIFNWMDASFYIGFGMKGSGKVWIDDITIEQTKEPIEDIVNGNFEEAALDNDFAPKGWYTALGLIGYANDAEDSTNYAYVDGEGVNGTKCVKIQQFEDDTTGSDDWYAWCTDFPFLLGYIYEVSMDIKAEHFYNHEIQFVEGWYHIESTLLENTDERLDETGSTNGWITLKDTIIYPTDYQSLPNIFRIELHGVGKGHADSLMTVWIDNVNCQPLGKTPSMINNDYSIVKNESGEYTINFDAEEGVTYTVLQEPLIWTDDQNIIGNPHFEEADSTGQLASWRAYERSEAQPDAFDHPYMAWLTPDQGMGIDGSGCVYIGPEDPDNQPKGVCAAWGQYYPGGGVLPDVTNIYLYRVMANYSNIEIGLDRTHKVLPDDNENVFNNDPTPEDSLNITGVYIFPRYYWDTFHYEKIFALGYDRGYGTSDGWEEQAYPFTPNDVFWKGWGHYFQVGVGSNYPVNFPCKGEVFFDDAAIVPFEEVMTGVTGGSFTITPPEGVRWLGICGTNDAGIKGAASVIYIDTTQAPTAIEEEIVAEKFELKQNYPNPFNPTTVINYYIPRHDKVSLFVYNLRGELVEKLIANQEMVAGAHRMTFDGSKLASGVYFYKLTAGKHEAVKKMMLVK
ncbi:MAG: T9SS type A sorting domain-containing protein [Candidatus Marinimicrobia bacterium]|nr:T9SS type A sorting domain-containing protein [Candidatus Neomarinimicrobiota bacterium]